MDGKAPKGIQSVARPALKLQSDERLVMLSREGHPAAFEAIVERYAKPLTRYCSRWIDGERSRDVVQDVMAKTFETINSSEPPQNLRAWLYRVTHNAAIGAAQLKANQELGLPADDRARGEQPSEIVERRENVHELVRKLRRLPDVQRSVIVAREMEGKSFTEIASELGGTETSVRQHLYRARARLRNGLGALLPLPLLRALLTRSEINAKLITAAAIGKQGAGGAVAVKLAMGVVAVGGVFLGAGVVLHNSGDDRASAHGARQSAQVQAPDANGSQLRATQVARDDSGVPVATATPAIAPTQAPAGADVPVATQPQTSNGPAGQRQSSGRTQGGSEQTVDAGDQTQQGGSKGSAGGSAGKGDTTDSGTTSSGDSTGGGSTGSGSGGGTTGGGSGGGGTTGGGSGTPGGSQPANSCQDADSLFTNCAVMARTSILMTSGSARIDGSAGSSGYIKLMSHSQICGDAFHGKTAPNNYIFKQAGVTVNPPGVCGTEGATDPINLPRFAAPAVASTDNAGLPNDNAVISNDTNACAPGNAVDWDAASRTLTLQGNQAGCAADVTLRGDKFRFCRLIVQGKAQLHIAARPDGDPMRIWIEDGDQCPAALGNTQARMVVKDDAAIVSDEQDPEDLVVIGEAGSRPGGGSYSIDFKNATAAAQQLVVWAPDYQVNLWNQAQLTGGVTADEIDMRSTAQVTWDASLPALTSAQLSAP